MLGAIPGGKTQREKGTSCAAPVVSGVAALLMSLQFAEYGRIDAEMVRQAILESSDPCDSLARQDCDHFMFGKLNIPGAVRFIKEESRKR
jgi:hypothetical protein